MTDRDASDCVPIHPAFMCWVALTPPPAVIDVDRLLGSQMISCMSAIMRGTVVVWLRTTSTVFMRAAIVIDTRAATRSAIGSRASVSRSSWVAMKRPIAVVAARVGVGKPFARRSFSQSL
ncbi:hypothetical protein D3C72_1140220 [compost metagenome]